jgi:transposase
MEVVEQGKSPSEVARVLGVTPAAVGQWRKTFQAQGAAGLQAKPRRRAGKLTAAQQQQLLKLLEQGPQHAGFAQPLWTGPLVQALIRKTFGVNYHVDHVGRLLHALGYSPQLPRTQARQRDEAAVQRWRRNTWPRKKRGA